MSVFSSPLLRSLRLLGLSPSSSLSLLSQSSRRFLSSSISFWNSRRRASLGSSLIRALFLIFFARLAYLQQTHGWGCWWLWLQSCSGHSQCSLHKAAACSCYQSPVAHRHTQYVHTYVSTHSTAPLYCKSATCLYGPVPTYVQYIQRLYWTLIQCRSCWHRK